ncbi:MAG: MFS transporter, partial [Chloroflexota bacterium]
GRSAGGWPLYLAAGACLGLFVWIERRLAFPLVDLRLFRRPNFTPAVLVNFLVGGVLIIAMINVPLLVNVLEVEVERAALVSGWLLSALTGAMALLAYVGGRLSGRWSYRPVVAAGLVACAAGFALMGQGPATGLPYGQMAGQLALLGAGFGLVIAPVGAAVINAAPETQRGVAASLVIVLRLMGMSVGLAGLTAWGLHRFQLLRTQLTLPPLTDPGFATAFAEGLTRVTVTVLTETFWVSAAVAAVALLAAWWLRPELDTKIGRG